MKTLKIITISTFFLFLFNVNVYSNNNDLVNKISKNIRCLIWQGQSVYDSNSDFANSIKLLIEKKLEEGHTESEIYTFLKNQYGEWITYDPEFNKYTFFLWLMPIFIFILGGFLIFRKIKISKL